ncbi:MAG: hypothetical protein N2037_14510, partial [Acidimicrobiales bacterium]|nr:hypothetical protein [Acidimicrobiales bacterium]
MGEPTIKAVLQYRASPGFRRRIEEQRPDWLEVVVVDETDTQGFGEAMANADVLLHVLAPVTAGVIRAAPQLKLIQKMGVGVNTIDLDAARAHGVGVANMPGTNTTAVAELTLALMLACLRRVVSIDAETRAGRGWSLDLGLVDTFGEIAGRTVGLVGFGAVGQRLARILRALDAEVLLSLI